MAVFSTGNMSRALMGLSALRPTPRRGLSRTEAAIYLGISPSKFDDLRKDGRIGPAKVLDGRKLYAIDMLDRGDLTFLVNDLGRPFTDAGFGNKFRVWCDQAGLKHCTAHGLRKAGATIAATNGATAHQLMAIFGWDTLKMAEAYTRAANQERLAEAAMHMLQGVEENRTAQSPTERPGGTNSEKNAVKSMSKSGRSTPSWSTIRTATRTIPA
jgi:Phage integrase family